MAQRYFLKYLSVTFNLAQFVGIIGVELLEIDAKVNEMAGRIC
jgi:hypothetical protein